MPPEKKTPILKHPLVKIFFWIALIWVACIYFLGYFHLPSNKLTVSYTDFKNKVSAGTVSQVTFKGESVYGKLKEPVKVPSEGGAIMTYAEIETTLPPVADPALLGLLESNRVAIIASGKGDSLLTTAMVYLLPWLLLMGFLVYAGRKMQGGMGGGGRGNVFSVGKSKAKLYTKSSSDVTFKDVAGLTNAKAEFVEIIDFLKDPAKYLALGAKLPKGVLLAGPPGVGKTLIARATAGEAGVPFFSISGSEFIEIFVGVGASRVRDLFENAKKDSPAIIFIDELDSIGRARSVGVGGGHEEREQTLNQILAEMDGFSPQESVIVMAATNRPDILDPALVRPGRFDRQVNLDLPQKNARHSILKLHVREVPLTDDVDLESLAKRTVGFSGAELKNLINEAALLAARKGKLKVDSEDLDQGMDKIIMGLEREDLVNDEEKRAIAYHEAGHALMAKLLPGADPLKRVSIIPRGSSLGATEQLPNEDRHNLSRDYLLKRIAIILGGRVAEKLVYNDITTGAGDDLKKATQLARRMVCQWGMSDALGPITFPKGEQDRYLGREVADVKDFSENTARLIDDEILGVLRGMEKRAEEILKSHRDKLDILANALLEQEVLMNDEVDRLLGPMTPPSAEAGREGDRRAAGDAA
ncbi:MAG: ATP-dependent zinc metalloprotease FtsH [Syntrophobacteraceae bacterium]|nr:ATP-dependent zinc metalloprotease FtsH [Desulfobacteraceae bacterium]